MLLVNNVYLLHQRNTDLRMNTEDTKAVPEPNLSLNPEAVTSLPSGRRNSARLPLLSESPDSAKLAIRGGSKPGSLFLGQSPRLMNLPRIFLLLSRYDSVLRRSINASTPTLLPASEIGNRYFSSLNIKIRFTETDTNCFHNQASRRKRNRNYRKKKKSLTI